MSKIAIEWLDHEREPQVAPNPNYPDGVDLDLTQGRTPACYVILPYPARRCGVFLLTCETCGLRVGITTAGRPDDPRSAKLACKRTAH